VGEVGLDYMTLDEEIRSQQRLVLSTVAGWASDSGDKILTVHSRRVVGDVISILRGIKAKVILHWFSGTKKDLECAIDCGFFFSVNNAMLRSEAGRALILRMQLRTPSRPGTRTCRAPGRSSNDVQTSTLDNLMTLLTTGTA